ncbi:hypothetical protein BEWA_022230 [Theileria equi strain WA]|uniref:Mediator of RNA polymerase II transcription subunit 14 n=1 Tax=Theileria equi strain WA TaxID=1537102 RepID=L0AV24_THEEQ|nr:hypothetical protein BEWA_022230 [Theileria equi strain WA]AFZ79375.1 hypothetical protein BEWA_022230 [Theileria equi strain WA]|eukprot:XP_004829041.1 hypothetical protein BEWA_022230 [Theileria equi strain WA]
MDDDFVAVPFSELLSRSVSRCITDWRWFCERTTTEGKAMNNRLRGALIQFCRSQREVFLKLRVLYDIAKMQTRIDKMIENADVFDGYLKKASDDLCRNLCTITTTDLIKPCGNTSLAADLLSCGTYTRMPLMIPTLVKCAVSSSLPVPPLSDKDVDDTMERIYDEYLYIYKLSNICNMEGISIQRANAQCTLEKKDFFTVTLIYDFNAWQVLDVTLLVLESSGHSSSGEIKTSMHTLLNMHIYANKENVFDCVYKVCNTFCGKLIMDRLKKQATEYKIAQFIVTEVKYYTSDTDSIILCSDVFLEESSFIFLDVSIFSGFVYKDTQGLTLQFKMDHNGNVSVSTMQVPFLDEKNICNTMLDHWIHKVFVELEKYQFSIHENPNVYVNYCNGALKIPEINGEFTLDEHSHILQLLEIRKFVNTLHPELKRYKHSSDDFVKKLWISEKCSLCEDTSEITIENHVMKEALTSDWFLIEEMSSNEIHASASFLLEEENEHALVLCTLLHGTSVSREALVYIKNGPRGCILLEEYSTEVVGRLSDCISTLALQNVEMFTTLPFKATSNELFLVISTLQICMGLDGSFKSIRDTRNDKHIAINSKDFPTELVASMMKED